MARFSHAPAPQPGLESRRDTRLKIFLPPEIWKQIKTSAFVNPETKINRSKWEVYDSFIKLFYKEIITLDKLKKRANLLLKIKMMQPLPQFLDSHIFTFASLIICLYLVVYIWTLIDVWSICITRNIHTGLIWHRICPPAWQLKAKQKIWGDLKWF